MDNTKYIEAAKANIVKTAGRNISVLRDYDWLSQQIGNSTHSYLSPTTLRRFWGYQERANLRPSSLDVIAAFLGYTSWKTFCEAVDNGSSIQSGSINRRSIATETLEEGALIELRWNPDRCVVVRYEGEQMFRIVSVEKSKLRPGGTFRCMVLLENEPLFLTALTYPDEPTQDYVCGQRNGVRFREIEK